MANKKTTKKGMHPEEIKAAIRMRGVTLGELAERWGFHRTAITHVLTRELPHVEARIAQFLGKSPHEIWPDRYTPEGIRIRHLSNMPNRSRSNPKSHCKK
ncbi:MAG: helix-turn-helix domain-containing protein [Alphaproteobacteria bacterium]|jgi:Ner family transcriptional regulator|nr:helix-turn-helix domain-containing protein [Alphaproteobacteria bacterium]